MINAFVICKFVVVYIAGVVLFSVLKELLSTLKSDSNVFYKMLVILTTTVIVSMICILLYGGSV